MYRRRVKYYIDYSRTSDMSFYRRGCFVFFGSSLVALSLQLFLVKNFVIDGGIIGISIILSHVTSQEVGLFLLLLNAPFFLIAYSFLGRRFLILSVFAILVLSLETYLLEPFPVLTNNPILVIILGGIALGLGVGITIRFGGCLDGTEVLAILFSKRSPFSIGQYVLLFNIFIFGSSIFIFGLNEAIYSLATFLVAYKTIDFSIQAHQ
ncbi:YitT family protein [Neobacillus novalis]|uniref:YitT family protein n=1 Tax=Neobacillus novalis TaxID=220687 RepID=A0AA95SA75_9BACI|nr:YitT family protein [Neobacillus novalis]WHY87810.1 YitT family protein [Neobacillus novalis]